MAAHEAFEQLCALAVTGEIAVEEFRQLQEHLHECPMCRACYRDFHSILGEGLPTLAEPQVARWMPGHFTLKKKFVERARKEGIVVSRSARPTWRIGWKLASAVALTVLLLLAWPAYRFSMRHSESDEKIAGLSRRIAEMERVCDRYRGKKSIRVGDGRFALE